jgi:hypothetical protein
VIQDNSTPREAVEQFLAGNLLSGGGFCRCHE